APGSGAEAAQQFGAEFITVPSAKAGDAIPGLGASPEIDAALTGLQPNGVSQVLVLPANRLAVAVLNSRTPGRKAELSEVESQVRDRLINDKTQLVSDAKAKEAAERLKKGEDINQVAKSLKLDVTSTN